MNRPLSTWQIVLLLILLFSLAIIIFWGKAQAQEPEIPPNIVYFAGVDTPDPGQPPPAEPDFVPGDPQPYRWSNIELKLWWPYSYTPRAESWGCLARAFNITDRTWHTLQFRNVPTTYIDHRFMHTIFNFTYLPDSIVQWSLTEGSCFILNGNGTVMYTKPIINLPWRVSLVKGPTVFVPSLKGGNALLARPEK